MDTERSASASRARLRNLAVRAVTRLVVRGRTREASALASLLFPPLRAAQARAARAGADAGTRFVHVFDPGLGPTRGHHLNFNRSIGLEVARRPGWGCLFHGRIDVCPEVRAVLPVQPFFLKGARWRNGDVGATTHNADPEAGAIVDPAKLARKAAKTRRWNEFHEQRLLARSRAAIRGDDVVIHHSILRANAGAIAAWLRSFPAGEEPIAVVAFMFGDYLAAPGEILPEYAALLDALAAFPPAKRFVVAETREIRNELTEFSNGRIPIETAPHFKPEQMLDGLLQTRAEIGRQAEPVCVGYVGHNRADRGSHLLPDVVERVATRAPALRFRVHFQDPYSQLAEARRLAEMPQTDFRQGSLSVDEYYGFLAGVDIGLFPYAPGIRTERRGSGIFWESLALGQVLVLPRGSHLERVAKRLGGGFSTYERWDPESIAGATLEASERYAQLAPLARAAGAKWVADHRLSSFMDRVLAQTATDL